MSLGLPASKNRHFSVNSFDKLFFDDSFLIKWKTLYALYFQGKSALWSHLIQFQDREEKQEHLAESPGENSLAWLFLQHWQQWTMWKISTYGFVSTSLKLTLIPSWGKVEGAISRTSYETWEESLDLSDLQLPHPQDRENDISHAKAVVLIQSENIWIRLMSCNHRSYK